MQDIKDLVLDPENKYSEQEKTKLDVIRILKKYHKCIIIRPTGFGKTYIMTSLIREYDKVLYLYPSAVIANTVIDRYNELQKEDLELEYDIENGDIDAETIEMINALSDNTDIANCDLMTYAMLIRKSDTELKAMASKYNLIICDEAHRLGGAKTKIAMEKLFNYAPENTDFVGATATPTRMDNFDVTSHFYSEHMPYPYTLHDAIKDNLIKKPNYCYATYNVREDIENQLKEDNISIDDDITNKYINAKAIELSKLYNMPSIIKDVCDKYAHSTDYMKFIIFFANKKHMTDKLDDVISWFQEAYPDHKVKTLKISSANERESKNTDKLNLLTPQSKTIDLIACIDMLNVGYHVSNQTGILMYRVTTSNTIFTQQLGRALSAGTDNSAIVFDIVDNLHRKAVYDIHVKMPNKRKNKAEKESDNSKAKLDNYILDVNTNKVLAIGDKGETIETQYHLDKNNNIVDKYGNPSTFVYDPESNEIINNADVNSDLKNINVITEKCLNATGHEATYREIIRKAQAESMVQRCKYVLQIHFASWCFTHKVEYPVSANTLLEIHDLNYNDFLRDFYRILVEHDIPYPVLDIEALLAIGKDGSEATLAICCAERNVAEELFTTWLIEGTAEIKAELETLKKGNEEE